MAPTRRRFLLILAAGVMVFALVSAWLTAIRTPPIQPEPVPNGYYDFAKAGASVSEKVGDFRDLDLAALRALVTTNAETLRLLRQGFGKKCAVPIQTAITNFSTSSSGLIHFKRLANLLAAEGRLAELEQRPADAALSYCDAIRLGNEISRDGFLICRLVGTAIESIGAMPLGKLVPKLEPGQVQPVIDALQKIDHSRVTWAEVKRSERLFMRHELRKVSPLSWPLGLWQNWKVMRSAEPRHKQAVARVRLLALDLALRRYFSDQGKPPASLEELVPNYLDAVPRDPFTDKPLVYRNQSTAWQVYSVGADRTDDGGSRSARGAKKGDIFLDSP